MRQSLETHNLVIVPWGAKRMPGLQKEIKTWGFVETGRARHQAFYFHNKTLISFISLLDRIPGESLQSPESL